MFTGIVEEMGRVTRVERRARSARLTIAARTVLEGTRVGDSILTAGVCLTVAETSSTSFTVDVQPETFARTTLANVSAGTPVNLERALAFGGRLGGHLVTGHIDALGVVDRLERIENATVVTLSAPASVTRASVAQGSIAVDGVSLTIVEVSSDTVRVSLIPHTAAVTTLGGLRPGTRVNLEADLIGKYVQAFLERSAATPGVASAPQEGLSWKKLNEAGFL